MYATHEQNSDLVEQIKSAAAEKGLVVLHNSSSWSNFDGWHRYLVGLPGMCNIRSKTCINYWETRYSREYKPSVSGERSCLEKLLQWINEYQVQQ